MDVEGGRSIRVLGTNTFVDAGAYQDLFAEDEGEHFYDLGDEQQTSDALRFVLDLCQRSGMKQRQLEDHFFRRGQNGKLLVTVQKFNIFRDQVVVYEQEYGRNAVRKLNRRHISSNGYLYPPEKQKSDEEKKKREKKGDRRSLLSFRRS